MKTKLIVLTFVIGLVTLFTSNMSAQGVFAELLPVDDSTDRYVDSLAEYTDINSRYDKLGRLILALYDNLDSEDSSLSFILYTYDKGGRVKSKDTLSFYMRSNRWHIQGEYLDKGYPFRMAEKALKILKE